MFKNLIANKHTSGAAVAYIASALVSQLGAVWFPGHKEQFEATGKIIESAAVGYGLLAAGDASNQTKPEDSASKQPQQNKPNE